VRTVGADHFSTGLWRADTPTATLRSHTCTECDHRSVTWAAFREHRRECAGAPAHHPGPRWPWMKESEMKRLLASLTLAAALALSGAAAVTTAAADVTSAGFTDQGTTLVAVGTVDGLDPTQGAQVNLTMTGTAEVVCVGTGVRRTVSVSQGGPAKLLKAGEGGDISPDGSAVFDVTTYAPVVTPENARCPASVEHVFVQDVVFQTAVITVIQGGVVEQFGYQHVGDDWFPVG
jgi:hypothetical protein